jgi:predicted peroxiredoxin
VAFPGRILRLVEEVRMAIVLATGTSGLEDPTKATLPFLNAMGTVEAGHEARVALIGDAVLLIKDVIAEQIHGVGWPPLKDVMSTVIANKTPIYI